MIIDSLLTLTPADWAKLLQAGQPAYGHGLLLLSLQTHLVAVSSLKAEFIILWQWLNTVCNMFYFGWRTHNNPSFQLLLGEKKIKSLAIKSLNSVLATTQNGSSLLNGPFATAYLSAHFHLWLFSLYLSLSWGLHCLGKILICENTQSSKFHLSESEFPSDTFPGLPLPAVAVFSTTPLRPLDLQVEQVPFSALLLPTYFLFPPWKICQQTCHLLPGDLYCSYLLYSPHDPLKI